MATAILFGLGLGIGALGTLIGAGGGWMIVPILLLGYGFAPQQAVGTSLAVVFLNALSGSIAYMAQRRALFHAEAVKGLEFDGVVVVNPHEIFDGSERGARLLYVAMTRAVQVLHFVSAAPLPAELTA